MGNIPAAAARETLTPRHSLWPAMLLFGSMGAITWAVRGTSGWGGIDGTIVPGMTWALLWYYLCRRNGVDARGVPLWLGLGIAIGGELGYGQYVSWIQGNFQTGNETVHLARWVGYAWFAICGAAWAGPGGIILGWTLSGKASLWRWVGRIAFPVLAAFLAWRLVHACPWLFFPKYTPELYSGALNKHLDRTVYTNTQNFVVAVWWAAALATALVQRDRTTVRNGALIGFGFLIGFPLAAVWCLGYTYAPGYIDWWKMWELNAGLYLGALYALALHWDLRQHANDASGRSETAPLSKFRNRWRWVSLGLSTVIFWYILLRGASYQIGGLLGLYDLNETNQYAWPPARTLLLAGLLLPPLSVGLFRLVRFVRACSDTRKECRPSTGRSCGLPITLTVLAAVGVATIWPSAIWIFYVLFLILAFFALTRLEHQFKPDKSTTNSRTI